MVLWAQTSDSDRTCRTTSRSTHSEAEFVRLASRTLALEYRDIPDELSSLLYSLLASGAAWSRSLLTAMYYYLLHLTLSSTSPSTSHPSMAMTPDERMGNAYDRRESQNRCTAKCRMSGGASSSSTAVQEEGSGRRLKSPGSRLGNGGSWRTAAAASHA
ncbi:hypothetical protein K466DRAFT_233474 [Polyporus arcularius HHB13444]|uniref:Uncharacterized protein n=1 Tax=Polyporus arcularius HHB13444 TaxID=1314778 RepID=A0A5C3P3I4_9APHY|nr:hypothetical protein K466DRAFT_233474 [Polyporus arcularius HHB13444]